VIGVELGTGSSVKTVELVGVGLGCDGLPEEVHAVAKPSTIARNKTDER
jgi:hypothetical protein